MDLTAIRFVHLFLAVPDIIPFVVEVRGPLEVAAGGRGSSNAGVLLVPEM